MERKALEQKQKQRPPVNEDDKLVDNLLNELHAGVPLRRRTLRKHQASMRASRRTISKKDRVKLQALLCANTCIEQNPVT